MGRDGRIRLFCALRLREETLDALEQWQSRHVPRGRRVARENLHLTLAFLGHRPADELEAIGAELRASARGAVQPTFAAAAYRETRSVAMVTLTDEQGRAAALAADLHARLADLGVYEPERRPWLPHVTVVRFRERPRLRPPLPELGRFGPSDAALYHSVLRSGGAQYEVLETVALGG